MSWSHYLLQVNIYLVVFYAFYRLLLAKETYFVLNRIYLISAGMFSLTIPFMQIEWFNQQEISQQVYVQVSQFNEIISQPIIVAPVQNSLNWGMLIVGIYLAGSIFFVIRFFLRLYAVKKTLAEIKNGLAFSFWKQKVVAQNLPEVATINHHEDIHIKQLHTFDVIFFEILGIITWFNPIIYLYKETVKSIHEYLADEAAAKFQGNKETYAMLLLNQAFGVNENTLTNGFFKKSMVKKRIFMLYKERSKKTAVLKYGIFLPLFAAALLLSSAKIRENEQILAVAEQVKLEEVKNIVAETLNLPEKEAAEIQNDAEKKAVPIASSNYEQNDIEPFYRYLTSAIKYPSTALKNKIQGNLVVTFTVFNKGIREINVSPKLGYGADEEVTVPLAKYGGGILADGKYCMLIEYRLNNDSTAPILNKNAATKQGFQNLNTIVIVGNAQQQTSTWENRPVHIGGSKFFRPSFPGGLKNFLAFVNQHIKYPEEAKKANIKGDVNVSFTVKKDGSLTDISTDGKLGYGTDEEAIRVLKLSPKWIPSSLGEPIEESYSMPIKFANNQPQSEDKHAQTAIEDKTVYSVVSMDNPPKFPGGMAKFYQFLSDNVKYPPMAAENNIQGNVFVSFTVEKDGSLSELKVDRPLGYGTDEEAIRVLRLSPKWDAGIQDGKAVRVKYNLPIKFYLRKTKYGATKGTKDNQQINDVIKLYEDQLIKIPEYASDEAPVVILNWKKGKRVNVEEWIKK